MKSLPVLLLAALASGCRTTSSGPRVESVADVPLVSESATWTGDAAPTSEWSQEPAAPQEQTQASADDGWDLLLKPYFFGYGIEGAVGTGKATSDVDADFTDLFDALNFGGMLVFEASPPQSSWTVLVDLMYVQIEDEGLLPGPGGTDVDAQVDQFIGELSAAYEIVDQGRLELLGGVRYWYITAELVADLPSGPLTAEASQGWLDPLLGARSRLQLGSKVDLLLRGDVGGFGVGSDFSYNLAAEVGVSLSEPVQLTLGYRYLDVDYEDDATYDVAQAGPTLGLAIRL